MNMPVSGANSLLEKLESARELPTIPAVLVPLLREDLPDGPVRADRMLDEHQRQRQMLASIHLEAYNYPELSTLAVKLGFLASWFLADMVEEERELSTLRPVA